CRLRLGYLFGNEKGVDLMASDPEPVAVIIADDRVVSAHGSHARYQHLNGLAWVGGLAPGPYRVGHIGRRQRVRAGGQSRQQILLSPTDDRRATPPNVAEKCQRYRHRSSLQYTNLYKRRNFAYSVARSSQECLCVVLSPRS